MSNTIQTRYDNLDLDQLHCLFGTKSWQQLTTEEKKDACQEVVNRYAEENNTWACRVFLSPLEGSNYGYESRGCIVLNEHLVKDGQFISEDIDSEGNRIFSPIKVDAPNWNVLDTVYHEGTHGIQEANGTLNRTYFNGSGDYNLYRIQSNEKEAYANGQYRTIQAIDAVQKYTGEKDVNAPSYYQTVKAESFQSYLNKAIDTYNDPHIENTVNQFIDNNDKGILINNPTTSYQAVADTYHAQSYSIDRTAGMVGHDELATGFYEAPPNSMWMDDGASIHDSQSVAYDESMDDGAVILQDFTDECSSMENDGASRDNGLEM